MATKLVPSAAFLSKLVAPEAKKQMTRIIREVEIYEYMATKVPKQLTDKDWLGLLERKTLNERVQFLEFVAVRNRREERDEQKKKGEKTGAKKFFEAEEQKYAAGGMGYGPDMYQLMTNQLRNKKRVNHVQASRLLQSMNLGVPEIALDMQYFMGMKPGDRGKIGLQLQYLISENFESRRPMPLSFHGFDYSKPDEQKLVQRLVGFYNTEHENQTLLPEFHKEPVGALKKTGKRVAYISNAARRVIDGPLNHDIYVICAAKDTGRLGLGSSRMNNLQSFRLPIQRYVKWESGSMYLPLNNTVRVLREVYQNNGDWSTALHNNISKRHLMSREEATIQNELRVKKRDEMVRQREELLALMRDGTQDL